jgi:hypothetical protein
MIQSKLSLRIREIKNCYEPACCTNHDFLSAPGDDASIVPTVMWKPTHPPRATVEPKARYPPLILI